MYRFRLCAFLMSGMPGACLLLAACHPIESEPVVRVGYLNITASLPLFVAEDQGFFAADGIQYQALPFATSDQLVDEIVSGNLDIAIEVSAVPVVAAERRAHGRLKIFAASSITRQAPFDALLVEDGSPVSELSQLSDTRIGVFPGSTATSLLNKFLADRGVAVSGIDFVPISPQEQITALLEGSVDAVHSYEPMTTIALVQGGVRRLFGSVYAEMLDRNPQGVAVVASGFVAEHSETARKSIRALERAMVFMREHEDEAHRILAERLGLDQSVAARSVFLYMLPHDEIDTSVLQQYVNMLRDLNELDGIVDVDGLVYGGT